MVGVGMHCVWLALGFAVPLVGTVADDAGRPVAGATVILGDTAAGGPPEGLLGRAVSDAAGRFRIDRADGLAGRGSIWSPTLWVYAPGHAVAFREFKRHIPTADEPVAMVLGPPASAAFRILLPDGTAAAGSRVQVNRTRWKAPHPPVALLDRLAATTDDDGRASVAGIAVADVATVDITAPGEVTQWHAVDPGSDLATVALHPIGRLLVRVTADDPLAVRGWQIRATTSPGDPQAFPPSASYVGGTTDPLGIAYYRPMAAGRISWRVEPPAGSPFLAVEPTNVVVRPGQLVRVSMPLRRGVRVVGTIRDGAGKPVAGIPVTTRCLAATVATDDPTTDAEGRFAFLTLPGRNTYTLPSRFPPAYVAPDRAGVATEFEAPDAPGDFALPPIEVERGVTVRGRVVDAAGKGVGSVRVVGTWQRGETTRSVPELIQTDERGDFALPGMPVGAEARAVAAPGPRTDSTQATCMVADPPGPDALVVRLTERPGVAVTGRVVGPDGRPVIGAAVTGTVRRSQPGMTTEMAAFDGDAPATTAAAADGTFTTPAEIPDDAEYRLRAEAPGFNAGESPWIGPGGRGPVEIRLLKMDRPRTVAGRVVDPQGRPVAGVEVFQAGDGPRRTVGRSDANGRFAVPGVGGDAAFVLARSPEHRPAGLVVRPDDRDPTLILPRRADPPARRLVAAPTPHVDDRALGLEWLEPIWQDRQAGVEISRQPNLPDALELMARLDPDRVLRMIRAQELVGTQQLLAATALWKVAAADPARALGVLDAVDPPADLAGASLLAAAPWMVARPDLADRLLDNAERQARRESVPPVRRRALLVSLALARYQAGAVDRGGALAREAEKLPEPLAEPNNQPGVITLAEALAPVDPDAALRLVAADPSGVERNTVRTRVARRLAANRPAEAARLVLANPPPPTRRPPAHPGGGPVVVALAAAGHLDAARDLARSANVDPITRALLPAIRAGRLDPAGPDGEQARKLLAESVAELAEQARTIPMTQSRPGLWPVAALAALLPVAARVDPDRADEYLWTVVSCRPPHPFELERRPVSPFVRQHYLNLAAAALLIAPYDSAVAAAVIAPTLDRIPTFDDARWGLDPEVAPLFGTLAAYDPAAARALWDALPPDPPAPQPGQGPAHRTKANARHAIAAALSLPPALRKPAALRLIEDAPWLDELAR